MPHPHTTTRSSPASRRGLVPQLSLERKLPLLISGLLLVVLAAFSWGAYAEVRNTAVLSATARLRGVAHQLADLSANGLMQRTLLMRSLAADSAVHSLLRSSDASAGPTVLAAMRRAMVPTDAQPALALLDAAGRPRGTLGGTLPAAEVRRATELMRAAAHPDSVHNSPFYAIGDTVFYWTVAPVVERGAVLGALALRRRLSTQPSTAKIIRELSGEDLTVYFANDTGSLWTTLGGKLSPPPLHVRTIAGTTEHERGDGRSYFVERSAIHGTPWSVAVDVPVATILQRATNFLRRIGLMVALLVLAGAACAWALSRHVTRPLAQLTHAAEALAAGEYSERVTIDRRDELGRLGATFNMMAARIEESRTELEQQAGELEDAAAELEMANEELQRTNDELAQQTDAHKLARTEAVAASQAKSDFLAVMSHELRTPLNAILGFSNLLIDEITGPLSGAQRSQLMRIRGSGEHLLSLIDQILSLSRVEAGQEGVYLETADACELVRETAGLVEPLAVAKSLRLDTHIPEHPLEVRTDLTKVRQIVLNLLSNAVKFTQTGSVALALRVEGDRVTFEVRDTGIGIPPDALARIFEPFYQVEQAKSRRAPGTGLGLSVTQHLARLLGGDIDVTSTVGAGSVFRAWLPIATAVTAPVPRGRWLKTPRAARMAEISVGERGL